LPKSGKIDIVALDSLLQSYENSILSKGSLSFNPSKISTSNTGASASISQLNSTRSKRHKEADLDCVLVESHDDMSIRRGHNFEDQTTQSQIDAKAAFLKIHEGNKALLAAMKQKFFSINDFGMSIGRKCLGELKSQALSENDEVLPDIQLLTIESNQTMPSALESPRMEEIVKPILSIAKTASTETDFTFESKNNEGIEEKISKEDSYGTEMLGSLLGVDVNAIRSVLSDRLMCNKGSRTPDDSYESTVFFDDRIFSKDSYGTKGSTSTDGPESCPSFDESTEESRSRHSLSFTYSMLEYGMS